MVNQSRYYIKRAGQVEYEARWDRENDPNVPTSNIAGLGVLHGRTLTQQEYEVAYPQS